MDRRALKAAALGGGLLVVVLWTAGDAWSVRRLPVAAPIMVTRAFVERLDTLRRRETLSHLFARHEITGPELIRLLAAADGLDPRRVPVGQAFRFRYPVDEPRPDRVRIRLGDERVLRLIRDGGDAWRGETVEIRWTVHLEHVAGSIASSLYAALHELIADSLLPAEERSRLVSDLADGVYGWVVDFTRDIYPGDRLELLYERLTSQLGDVRYGRVVAARLTTRGDERPAYVLTGTTGGNEYFDAEGRSLRGAFRLSPVAFRYISSGFSHSRLHPVLGVRRPHLGADYRAAQGAPVRATGDGTVARAGRWGGYGIVVVVRHPKGIETRYAHMSRLAPGVRPGARVTQDQTIGFVGMTGLATAPHVHYEFIQGRRHLDPRAAIRFGTGDPVPAARRAEFDSLRIHYDRLFALFATPSHAAGAD